jgi:OmpA-OmpF porin, OOP family
MDSRKFIFLVLLASAATTSHADGFFVNTSLGKDNFYSQYPIGPGQSAQISSQSDTEALRVGYRWNSGVFCYGLETGYVNLGPSYYFVFAHYEERIDGALLGPTLKYSLPMGFFVSARGGFFRSTDHEMARLTYGLPFPKTGDFYGNVSGIGSYVGLGAGYDFNQSFGLSLNYDRYRPHVVSDWWEHGGVIPGTPRVDAYTVTAEYRF